MLALLQTSEQDEEALEFCFKIFEMVLFPKFIEIRSVTSITLWTLSFLVQKRQYYFATLGYGNLATLILGRI